MGCSPRVQVPDADVEGLWVRTLDESEDYRFGGLFRVVRAKLQYRRSDGQLSAPVQRISFERGDSVGVLLYDRDQDVVILVRQFRFPVYAVLDPEARTGDGARQAWLLEIVAGVRDEDLTVREVAHKELLEEAGYLVDGELEPIASIYASPGGSSERIHLFLGNVKADSAIASGGGTATEGEDTQVVVVSVVDAIKMVAQGEIQDAKTVVALQYLALQRVPG